MRPRLHNVVSYSITLLVFLGLLLWREQSESWGRSAKQGAALWCAHFLRRALESACVHRYAGILASWAHTRHVAYRREFDGREGRESYPASRRALIPFLF